MNDTLKLRIAAKLNLDLFVFPPKDGYHPIDSIFCSVGLYDDISIQLSKDPTNIHFTGPYANDIPASNTVTKTLEALSQYTNPPHFAIRNSQFAICVSKNIPSGAGLGGGSADAAGLLLGLNKMLKLELSTETLQQIGSTVGSDVPFFIEGGTAHVTGRGENVQPIAPLSGWVALIKPKHISCATAEIYKRFDELIAPNSQFAIRNSQWPARHNDLYHAVTSLHPAYELWMQQILRTHGGHTLLTGSGASFFSWVETQEKAQGITALFESEDFDTWVLPLVAQSIQWLS